MNIESSHKFNRSGDTAYGCIEGVNLMDYQIGVFSLVEVVPTVPTSKHGYFCVQIDINFDQKNLQGPGRVLDVGIIVPIVVGKVYIIIL
jgi:hypothetical protein